MKLPSISLLLLQAILTVPVGSFAQKNAVKQMTAEQYISRFSEIAIREMHLYGIPASITLAQGLLESGNGNSPLAVNANNHFGIKCHKEWQGETYYQDDDEKNECFRKYKTPEESFEDHSRFLKERTRYAFLFQLDPTDYKAWAKGLKEAGYATNPKYPELLIDIIERYSLHRFDTLRQASQTIAEKKHEHHEKENPKKQHHPKKETFAEPEDVQLSINNRQIFVCNDTRYIIFRKTDNMLALSRELEMMLWELYRYNDLPKGTEPAEGERIYLQPKKAKAQVKTHIVQPGETLRSISQLYAVRLKKLAKYNGLQPTVNPSPGIVLKLQK